MRIVIDSNILFSSLIKDSKIRELILNYPDKFLFPEFIFLEVQKHQNELLNKSGLMKHDMDKLLHILLSRVEVIPNSKLKQYRREALKIVDSIDRNDAIFFACALKYKNSIIWSDDKKLKKQNKVIVLNTQEMIKNIPFCLKKRRL
jgi:predicted nucleic acid-binding protein